MQNFSFTDYSFSTYISIFAAVIGLGYPLILQVIQRMNEQYTSIRISNLFTSEKTYKCFQGLLFVSLFFALVSSFVLEILEGIDNALIIWISVHCIVTFLLVLFSIIIFQLMLVYYNPDALLDHIMRLGTGAHLLEIYDIAQVASKTDEENLYKRSMRVLMRELHNSLVEKAKSDTSKLEGVTLEPHQQQLLNQIQRITCSKKEGNYFEHDSFLPVLWYPEDLYIPLSKDTRKFIWDTLQKIINADKKDWFINYWTFACQYFDSQLRGGYSDDKYDNKGFIKQQIYFKELHVAIAASLLFHKKYEWLDVVLNFTQTDPPSYPLVDNTFDSIWSDLIHFNDYLSYNKVFQLSDKFPMHGSYNDVNSDYFILSQITQYLAILVLRLEWMNFNVSYKEPYDLPNIENARSIPTLKKYEQIVLSMIQYLGDESLKTSAQKLGLWNDDSELDALMILQDFQKVIDSQLQNILKNPEIDDDKINFIKNNLCSILRQVDGNLPIKKDSKLENQGNKRKHELYFPYMLSDSDIYNGRPRTNVNLENLVIRNIVNQAIAVYTNYFQKTSPSLNLQIHYQDLSASLHSLNLNSDYAVVSFGISIDKRANLNGAKIIELSSKMSSIAILKIEDLPYVEYIESSSDDEKIKCIDEHLYLYSNIESLVDLDSKNEKPILKVIRTLDFIYKDSIPYLLMKVSTSFNIEKFDYDKIKPVTELITAFVPKL